jgi:hypothetical protein
MVNKFYEVIQGLKNIINWLPVVFKDRQWDEEYLYKIIHHKLKLKEEFFRSENTYSAKANEVAYQIKEVKEALERLIKDDYLTWNDISELTQEYFEKEDDLRNRDLDLVFSTIRNKVESWWD